MSACGPKRPFATVVTRSRFGLSAWYHFWVPEDAGFAGADARMQFDAGAALPVFTLTHLPPIRSQPCALAGVHDAVSINTAESNAVVSATFLYVLRGYRVDVSG